MWLEQTLKQHDVLIDKHEDKLDKVQQDVIDIKARLGIKDLTNGQVVKYQEQLVKSLEDERLERKEQDQLLMEQISKIDERLWFVVVGIILSVLLEIVVFLVQSHL